MHTGRKGRHHEATGDCRRKGSGAVGLLATLAEALKESESLPELILKDSYKHTVGVRPGQILPERTTATPEQKARSLDGKAWAQTEAKGQRSQVDQGSEGIHGEKDIILSWPKERDTKGGKQSCLPALHWCQTSVPYFGSSIYKTT